MTKSHVTAVLLAAGVALAAGTILSRPALALSTETYSLNPNARSNLANPDQKTYQLYKHNDDALTGNSDGDDNSSGDGSHNLTFGSPNSGFSFSVGRTDNSDPYDPFNSRQRFFGPDPFQPPR